MAEQNQPLALCRNGHQQPAVGSNFCMTCGVPLRALAATAEQNQAQPNQQPSQNPARAAVSTQPPPPPGAPVPQAGQQNYQPPPLQPNLPPHLPPPQQQPQHQPRPMPPAPHMQLPPPPPAQAIQPGQCSVCGGGGQGLSEKTIICRECGWLRPLTPGYRIDAAAFAWAADGKAMATLRSMKTLNAAAQAVSEKVGRRWIEVTFNGVLLGEKQLPHIYAQAVRAARILGMSHMPDVYLSGERPWDCLTFGSDKDSFVVIGSALAGNFQGADMLFLLAREMGHCRAGHALWKTVIRFLLGEQGPGKGFMAGGIFSILSPTALIGGAIEMPLLAWARQAEITADRAGLLTIGDEEIARRVLLSWSLKSSLLYRQINLAAWLEQQAADDGGYTRLSELTTTSTPYIAPRLKLLAEYARSPELQRWRTMISDSIKQGAGKKQSAPPVQAKSAAPPDALRLKCATCQTPMRVPLTVLAGKSELPVKCPNPKCGKITRLKKSAKPAAQALTTQQAKQKEENLNYVD